MASLTGYSVITMSNDDIHAILLDLEVSESACEHDGSSSLFQGDAYVRF